MHNPTPVAAPLVSPLPAKRLYSEAWGASNTQVSKAVSRSARFSPSRLTLALFGSSEFEDGALWIVVYV